ncbi:hypothetical protein CPC08DRAFT_766104 [Agrocybe pediades]|nr:hypothetical protein CPC08DRAFT_766104 [Agrocybe pediades]
MSTLHQKPISLDQKENRNLANHPLSTRSTLSSNAAPRNLRLLLRKEYPLSRLSSLEKATISMSFGPW